MEKKYDTILVLDFGGQYCHLIGRRIRENGVYSEIVPHDIKIEEIKKLDKKINIKGLILSGGPSSVYERDAPKMDNRILTMGLPILGLCYGLQLIAHITQGKVKAANRKEYGTAYVSINKNVGILKGLGKKEKVWMSHGDTVYEPSPDYEILAYTKNCPVAAFKHRKKQIYGLQWHPEVIHTKNGSKMLKNFHI